MAIAIPSDGANTVAALDAKRVQGIGQLLAALRGIGQGVPAAGLSCQALAFCALMVAGGRRHSHTNQRDM